MLNPTFKQVDYLGGLVRDLGYGSAREFVADCQGRSAQSVEWTRGHLSLAISRAQVLLKRYRPRVDKDPASVFIMKAEREAAAQRKTSKTKKR